MAILIFFDQSGSRIFEPIFFTNLYYRSWKFAIRISKIYQCVLNLSAKTRFSAAILKFYDHTGSRIYEPIYLTNHYHRSWKFTVKILKISQLVLKLLAKTRFSAAILNFYDHTGSWIFEPIYFTNHYHRSWKFAIKILKISQLVLKLSAKNQFSAAILNFYDQTGSRIFKPIFFTNLYYWSWKFAIRILKISQFVLKLSAKKPVFAGYFEFLRPNRK